MFTKLVSINFFDTDAAGVLFFGNLFRLAHSAYEEFMSEGNFEKNYFLDKEFAIPIVHTEANYLKPILPSTQLKVELTVEELKESSFALEYFFINGNQTILAKAKTVHVFVSKKEWKKTPIPADVKSYLMKHVS